MSWIKKPLLDIGDIVRLDPNDPETENRLRNWADKIFPPSTNYLAIVYDHLYPRGSRENWQRYPKVRPLGTTATYGWCNYHDMCQVLVCTNKQLLAWKAFGILT